MSTPSPTWALVDPDTGESLSLTEWPFGVVWNAVEVGEPEVQVEELASALADGDWAEYVRDGNRTYVIPVVVEGFDLNDVARNEAALRRWSRVSREIGGARLLRHDPGDGIAPPSDYEVKVGACSLGHSDVEEAHGLRVWTVTLTCGPHARSVEPVTVNGTGGTPVITVIDTADSTTGWTASQTIAGTTTSVTPTATGGYVSAVATSDPNMTTIKLERAGSVDFSAAPYLIVEWRPKTVYGRTHLLASGANEVSEVPLSSGWFRTTFEVAGTLNSLEFYYQAPNGPTMDIREVSKSTLPIPVAPRQVGYTIAPGGTERTPASLRVSGSATLGTTIVHTSPDDGSGYSPPLTRWRVSGNTQTADASLFSGYREPLYPNPVTADVPLSAVPEGGYVLAAYLRSDTADPYLIDWSLSTVIGGATAGPVVSGSTSVNFTATGTWKFYTLAMVTLPTIRAADGFVRVTLNRIPATPVIEVAEWWLFRVDEDCALTVVDVPKTNLWLDAPSLSTRPQPRLWIGDAADRSDQRSPEITGLLAAGNHHLSTGGSSVFVATAGVDYPGASSTHHMRWHTNAAEGMS